MKCSREHSSTVYPQTWPHLIPKVCGGSKVPRRPSNATGVIASSKEPVISEVAKVKPKSNMEEIIRPLHCLSNGFSTNSSPGKDQNDFMAKISRRSKCYSTPGTILGKQVRGWWWGGCNLNKQLVKNQKAKKSFIDKTNCSPHQ